MEPIRPDRHGSPIPTGSEPTFVQHLARWSRSICQWRISAGAMTLAAMWLFIAAVASVDFYLSIKYEFELLTEELNPVGRWLMALDGGSVSLFMACKFFCNLLALAALQILYLVHRPLCFAAAGVMTAVQACLAVILLA